jgi:alpha-glucosidase
LTLSALETSTAMVLVTALIGLLSSGLVVAQKTCPGYHASNVQQTANGLTANLDLAGPACNIFGTDLRNLTLTVEYQTGKRSLICQLHPC